MTSEGGVAAGDACIYCDAMNIPGASPTIEVIDGVAVCSQCGKHWSIRRPPPQVLDLQRIASD